MTLIRPELTQRLRPWREVIAAAMLLLSGIWVFSLGGLMFQPLGVLIAVFAVGWAAGAWRRMRFARRITAPGLVEVDEGAVRLFGALLPGGEVALNDLTEIRLVRIDGRPHWRLRTQGGEALLVPAEAQGAAALADGFAALPGFDLRVAVAALEGTAALTTVWRRNGAGVRDQPRPPA